MRVRAYKPQVSVRTLVFNQTETGATRGFEQWDDTPHLPSLHQK